jgi:hypothetical protein
MDISTLSGQHILSHLWQYVERYVEIIDGKPFRKGFGKYYILGRRYDEFYIDPNTGILCEAARLPKVLPPQRKDFLKIDREHWYQKIDDIWYRVTYKPVPAIAEVRDMVLKTYIKPETSSRPQFYAAHKRQCNKKEIQWICSHLEI